jgi:penicillin-binding protein 2
MKTEGRDRIAVITVALVLAFTVLAARLWHLQIVKGTNFKRLSYENRLRIVKVPAPRGIIYDRNGKPLVKNSPYYSVSLMPEIIEEEDLEEIAYLLGIDVQEIQRVVGQWEESSVPIKLKDGLSFEAVAQIEARLSDYPALSIEVEQTRHYLYEKVGAHLIGYLGKLNPEQVHKDNFRDVPRQALIGQWGVEKMYDNVLRGTPGKRIFEVDALGRKLREISFELPVKGQPLYLSIDIDMQKKAEEAFKSRTGALVAIKPATGEVLGLVSLPSFDPNLFSRGISYEDWLELSESMRYPMLNRALQSQYPPGSTFKIVTAIAALESGTTTPEDEVTCRGNLKYGRWSFGCWRRGGHGKLSMHRAIVESCDVYFYKAGLRVGIDIIAKYARSLGLGAPAGVGLVTEKPGLIPDTEWKKRVRNEPWYPGETFNASIGQGFVLTTPVQLARMIGMVANGGYLHDIKLVRVDDLPVPAGVVHLEEKTLSVLKDALRGVVQEKHGTGYTARSGKIDMSGKTGTSQVISQRDLNVDEEELPYRFRDHAWFVAYAPSEEPKIALSVFVEHGGHGGAAAAPIARQAIEEYMGSQEAAREY